MKTNEDQRLWFDKADGQTLFGLFPDQRFYAVQYETEDEDDLAQAKFLMEVVQSFSDWCKDCYVMRRSGQPMPPMPEGLKLITSRQEEVVYEAETSEAQSDTEEG